MTKSLKGSRKRHVACENYLEDRLREKYPGDLILRNVLFGTEAKTHGEVDILRITPSNQYIVYEVKTSIKGHYLKAQRQIQKFQRYLGKEVKGVYYHPERGIKRVY